MSLLLVAAVALPALGGLIAALSGTSRTTLAGRGASIAAGAAFVAGVAVAVAVVTESTVTATVSDGGPGLVADRVTIALLLLVLGVSTVVQVFARRYLLGDIRAARFFALAGLLTTATAATVASATLVGLALAWSLSSVALCALLALYRGFPAADEGVRRTVRAFVIGDGALWAAVTVAVLTWGDLNLRALATAGLPDPADPTTITIVALLLVVAAMARSAQVPLQSWLPATIAAPTPVSALLHAGMINGGGVLLVRTSPIFGASTAATHLAFAVGATTAIYGTALMLAKPDVKGALAHSTMGQMGFMVMTCGLGAFGAAIFHLVAHGLYKSTLFLGSGGAMRRHARHLKAPPRPALAGAPQLRALALAAALPAGAILLGDTLLPAEPLHGHGGTALLIFAWATGAALTWGWLRRTPSLLGTLALVPTLGIATLAYLGALRTATGFLDPSLVAAGTDTVSAWALLPVLAIGGALSLIRAPRFERHTRRAHEQLYVWALGAGHLGRRPTRRRTPPRQAAAWPGILIPRSEGGHS